ncbi:MAG: hypothetical protein RBR69_08340, partial [Candidatus Cloacimonadaceae bacterium]|nr:hypothetical protein [Candidatus Cloacimonadaceae bacterium]
MPVKFHHFSLCHDIRAIIGVKEFVYRTQIERIERIYSIKKRGFQVLRFSGFQVLKCGSAGVLGAGVGLIERGLGGSGGLIGFKRGVFRFSGFEVRECWSSWCWGWFDRTRIGRIGRI